MSFILDALKKSENERQRQTGPGFAAVPERSRERTRNRWPIILGILVALNLCALAFLAFRGGGEPAEPEWPSAAAPAAAVEPVARSPQVSQGSSAPSVRERSGQPSGEDTVAVSRPAPGRDVAETREKADRPEREVRGLRAEAEAAPSQAATSAEPPPPASPSQTVAPSTASGSTTRSRPARPAAAEGDDLPTANDLRLQGFLTGPPLHLDLHVFYPESHRRVVFISGSKYREGDQVANGPVVREIVPEGVILEERGRRYLLMPD